MEKNFYGDIFKKFVGVQNGHLKSFGFKTEHLHISVSKADVVTFQASF